MRGKRTLPVLRAKWHRNIPAYAGKTLTCINRLLSPREHPRVCGENLPSQAVMIGFAGTSPRMRGKLNGTLDWHLRWRNIPAYAGKTAASASVFAASEEHPRVCGENYWCAVHDPHHGGTSPRMRGKQEENKKPVTAGGNIPAYAGKTQILPAGKPHAGGNIPAYAGKTRPPTVTCQSSEEHPRVCGENGMNRGSP